MWTLAASLICFHSAKSLSHTLWLLVCPEVSFRVTATHCSLLCYLEWGLIGVSELERTLSLTAIYQKTEDRKPLVNA